VKGAPLLSAGFAIVALALVWGVLHFLYRHRISGLKDQIDSLKTETTRLRERITELAQARLEPMLPVSIAPEPAKTGSASRDLGLLAQRTLNNASYARSDVRGMRSTERALAEVMAVLVTLRKERGIRAPQPIGNARFDLEGACRLLEGVWPFLFHGHDDEARRFAEEWASKLDASENS
jgi:hypothetical protein